MELPRGDLFARADDADHLGADALDRDLQRLEHARGETFLFAQQAEQDVLCPDVVVLERPCLSCARTTTWRARSVNRSNISRLSVAGQVRVGGFVVLDYRADY